MTINKNQFFENIFNEAFSSIDKFTEVDLSNLCIRFPEGVTDLSLSISRKILKLKYTYNKQFFIKYYSTSASDYGIINNIVRTNREIQNLHLDSSKCIGHLVNTKIAFDKYMFPKVLLPFLVKSMCKQFPNGVAKQSIHLDNAIIDHRSGHGTMPEEILKNWNSRVIRKVPTDVEFIREKVGEKYLIIPVKVTYNGICNELLKMVSIGQEAIEKITKHPVEPKMVPSLVAVYDFPAKTLITEFFKPISIDRAKYFIGDDSSVKPWNVDDFTDQQRDDFCKSIMETADYYSSKD